MPTATKSLDPAVLDRLSSLSLVARTVVEGFLAGQHRSSHLGSSVEFAQHREYVLGDELRRVDWKVFGRSDRLVVKQFVEEENLVCHLLLDASESMAYGSLPWTKLDYARWCAAALSHLVLSSRDTAGLVVFDEAFRAKVPPGNGAVQRKAILDELEKAEPAGSTSVGAVLKWVAPKLKHRGIVCLFSDFFDRPQDMIEGVKLLLSGGHEPILFQILDPEEIAFDFESLLKLEGLEASGIHKVDPRAIRAAYLEEIGRHNLELARAARGLSVDFVPIQTSAPLEASLSTYLAHRMARVRGGEAHPVILALATNLARYPVPAAGLAAGPWSVAAWIGGFVNPALLAGLSLASVPVIIHLLNRQRHRPMPWAAMRFVLAAYRRTRRRVQLENLLLLLLRVAAIALLAFAISRPFAGDSSPLARLTESRRDLALVIDGSASTGYREGVETVFEREIARAREILRDLDSAHGDRVRLILAGAYARTLSWSNPSEALSLLDTLTAPTDEPLDLAAALSEVLEFAQEGEAGAPAGAIEIRLLCDSQRRSFLQREDAPAAPAPGKAGAVAGDGKPPRPALYEVLDALSKRGCRVLVEDFGASEPIPPNLGVASVSSSGPALGPGIPAEIRVEVRNFGASVRRGVRLALDLDGESRPSQSIDVPARGRAEAVFTLAIRDPGEHVLQARLEGDRLAADDHRFHVISVPPPLRVLLVDGAPAAAIEEDEIGYLRAVLDPPLDDGSAGTLAAGHPFEPREASPEALSTGEVRVEEFDAIWLANVESLPPAVVETLERAVAGGAALIISLGDRVTPQAYDTRLWRADGTGLLPAEILSRTAVPSRRDSYFRVRSFDEQCPALSFFDDERWKPLFTEVPIYEFFSTRLAPGARALATLDDPGSSALLVERAFDRGRVLLWTSTIDSAWTRLPESPRTLVPLAHELLRYAARTSGPARNLAPGEPIQAEAASFPRALALSRPDGSRDVLDGVAEELPGGRWRLPTIPGKATERAGLYRIEMDGTTSRAGSMAFAVCMDPDEGDLERIGADELSSLHPALVAVSASERGKTGVDPGDLHRGELWRGIAIACLVALVLESIWAAWIGRRRSV